MKTTLLLGLSCLALLGCEPAKDAPEEEKQDPIPKIGEKLSHNYSQFNVYEASEKWTKYKVCTSSACGCEGSYVRYFITCRNGNDEIISIWNDCEKH